MSEQEKISVIVPVFNAEKFLPETLEALCGQTWKNLEIILIDDASTDSSARICAEYAAKDPRLILIRKTIRQGQGAARNEALRIASGAFVGFCDSDDLPDPGMYETLYRELVSSDAEIAVCAFRTRQGDETRKTGPLRILSPREAVLAFLQNNSFGAFSWNKLFRIEVLKRTGEYPAIGYEDLVYIPQVCANARKIVRTEQTLYFYRQHPGSVTCAPFNPWKMNLLKAWNMLLPPLLRYFPDLSEQIYGKAWFDCMGLFHSILRSGTPCPEEAVVLEQARKYRQKTALCRTPSFGKALVFSFALRFPGWYRGFFRLGRRIRFGLLPAKRP